MKKKIHIFLFDGFSDWEISYLTPEINKSEDFDLIFFSQNGDSVLSMGGLRISPTISMEDVKPNEVEMLILPGGTAWETCNNNFIDSLTMNLFESGKTIAAICAATTYLGQIGLLNNTKHTSNDLTYLKSVSPDYLGEEHYINALAVSDKNIITANGIAPIEFAREIFSNLKLYSENDIEKWFQLFKNGVWSE